MLQIKLRIEKETTVLKTIKHTGELVRCFVTDLFNYKALSIQLHVSVTSLLFNAAIRTFFTLQLVFTRHFFIT